MLRRKAEWGIPPSRVGTCEIIQLVIVNITSVWHWGLEGESRHPVSQTEEGGFSLDISAISFPGAGADCSIEKHSGHIINISIQVRYVDLYVTSTTEVNLFNKGYGAVWRRLGQKGLGVRARVRVKIRVQGYGVRG